jgi:hypothetical protein
MRETREVSRFSARPEAQKLSFRACVSAEEERYNSVGSSMRQEYASCLGRAKRTRSLTTKPANMSLNDSYSEGQFAVIWSACFYHCPVKYRPCFSV